MGEGLTFFLTGCHEKHNITQTTQLFLQIFYVLDHKIVSEIDIFTPGLAKSTPTRSISGLKEVLKDS